MDLKPTISIKEAAVLLGFKGTGHLSEKAKAGKIPGAFKASNRWMFLTDELLEYMRNFSKNCMDTREMNIRKEWRYSKGQTANTIIPDFRSAESACMNRREQLLAEKRKSMKKNDGRK